MITLKDVSISAVIYGNVLSAFSTIAIASDNAVVTAPFDSPTKNVIVVSTAYSTIVTATVVSAVFSAIRLNNPVSTAAVDVVRIISVHFTSFARSAGCIVNTTAATEVPMNGAFSRDGAISDPLGILAALGQSIFTIPIVLFVSPAAPSAAAAFTPLPVTGTSTTTAFDTNRITNAAAAIIATMIGASSHISAFPDIKDWRGPSHYEGLSHVP